jgi:hypothetical protein
VFREIDEALQHSTRLAKLDSEGAAHAEILTEGGS